MPGPGAGAAVTAAGFFSNIMEAALFNVPYYCEMPAHWPHLTCIGWMSEMTSYLVDKHAAVCALYCAVFEEHAERL